MPESYYSLEEELRDDYLQVAFTTLEKKAHSSSKAHDAVIRILAAWLHFSFIPDIVAEGGSNIILNDLKQRLPGSKVSRLTWGEHIRNYQFAYLIEKISTEYSNIFPKSKDYPCGIFNLLVQGCSGVNDLETMTEDRIINSYYQGFSAGVVCEFVGQLESWTHCDLAHQNPVRLPLSRKQWRKSFKVSVHPRLKSIYRSKP